MTEIIPVFKSWVPQWMIKATLFIVILPSLVTFFLPLANVSAAAGYYGIEPADVQLCVMIFYAGLASFFALEKRFFSYLAAKEYFFIFTFIQILTSYICYSVNSLPVLLICRFIQGMCMASTSSLSMALIFNRLKSERAREIGYSVFYGTLVSMVPINSLITSDIIDAFNYNTLYKCAMFSYIPCLVLLAIFMNNVRLNKKFPLYKLDWASFSIYAIFLCLLGYMLVYGQQYYWFSSKRILFCGLGAGFFLVLFIIRQLTLKRPYFDMEVFKYRNFTIGALLLFTLYICRFASALTSAYFSTVLGLDPIHLSYINVFNLTGIISGVIISCALVIQRKKVRLILMLGFSLLLAYHASMFFLLNAQANENVFYIPLFAQGLGVGLLMTPIVIFMISAVPARLGVTAAGICLLMRCLGFYSSAAIINFYELFAKSKHYNTFQDQLTRLNPVAVQSLVKQGHKLLAKGVAHGNTLKIANRLLVKNINAQAQIRFTMDYYEMISWLLLFTVLLVTLFPYLNRTVIYLRSGGQVPF